MSSNKYQLILRSGPNPGQAFALDKEIVSLGRDLANEVVINDPEVSRRHTKFTLQYGAYVIEDLGSTNGTFVNGQRLMGPHSMQSGEVVRLGENVELVFEVSGIEDDSKTVIGMPSEKPIVTAAEPFIMPSEKPVMTAAEPIITKQEPVVQYVSPAISTSQPPVQGPPAYVGKVPAGPDMMSEVPPVQASATPPKKGGGAKAWLLAGCGCLILLVLSFACVMAVIDYLDLWCTLFGWVLPGC